MSLKKLFTKIIGDRVIIFFLSPLIIFLITLTIPTSIQKPYIDKYYDSLTSTRIHLGKYIGQILTLKENKKIIPLKKLYIDVNHRNFMKLSHEQQEVIERGHGGNYDFSNVNANITYKEKKFDVRIRLKGDNLNQFINNQWSYRINVKGGDHLMGMKVFSLHHQKHRNYIYEWIYLQALKKEGIIAPRYHFVEAILNGNNLGIYAIEEHFSKEILESNNRREGPIIRFDENIEPSFIEEIILNRPASNFPQLSWPNYLFHYGHLKGFKSAEGTKYSSSSDAFLRCATLIEKYRDGSLSFSEVFDTEQIAKHAALSFIFGALHGLDINNQRFYCNPVTGKIEPIGYDGNAGTTQFTKDGHYNVEEFYNRFETIIGPQGNNEFYFQFVKQLEKYSDPKYLDSLFNKEFMEKIDENIEKSLQGHSVYERISLNKFNEVASLQKDIVRKKSLFHHNQRSVRNLIKLKYSIVAYLTDFDGKLGKIEVSSLHPLPIQLTHLSIDENIISIPNIVLSSANFKYPFDHSKLNYHSFNIELPFQNNENLNRAKIHYKVYGSSSINEDFLINRPRKNDYFFIMENNTNSIINQSFDNVSISFEKKEITIKKGKWKLDKPLYIPEGFIVKASAGTELEFNNNSFIFSKSAFHFNGTKELPILITSKDNTGNGLIITGVNNTTYFNNVIVSNLSTTEESGFDITSPITFYDSNLVFNDVTFLNNKSGDDLLNIIRSKFFINNSQFSGSLSDALDIDFSEGIITNSVFVNCGLANANGDCIDFSGTSATLDNIYIDGAGDKALSAGEASQIKIKNIRISNASMGIVSKDKSVVTANEVYILKTEIGLLAYQKKSEYGPGVLIAKNVIFKDTHQKYERDDNSIIQIENQLIRPISLSE
jgi:hypothetical protein